MSSEPSKDNQNGTSGRQGGGPKADMRCFIMKSFNHQNIAQSIEKGIWATQKHNEEKLNEAFYNTKQVYLIFSVNMSGYFQGYALMTSPVGQSQARVWEGNASVGGTFAVEWQTLHDLAFNQTEHIRNPLNEGKPVKISRDGQELPAEVALEMFKMFDEGAGKPIKAGAASRPVAGPQNRVAGSVRPPGVRPNMDPMMGRSMGMCGPMGMMGDMGYEGDMGMMDPEMMGMMGMPGPMGMMGMGPGMMMGEDMAGPMGMMGMGGMDMMGMGMGPGPMGMMDQEEMIMNGMGQRGQSSNPFGMGPRVLGPLGMRPPGMRPVGMDGERPEFPRMGLMGPIRPPPGMPPGPMGPRPGSDLPLDVSIKMTGPRPPAGPPPMIAGPKPPPRPPPVDPESRARGRSRSPRQGRSRHRSYSHSRSRSLSPRRSPTRPNILDMSYDDYLDYFDRVKRKMRKIREEERSRAEQLSHDQGRGRAEGGVGMMGSGMAGGKIMSEAEYVVYCEKYAKTMGIPFNEQLVRQYYHQMRARYRAMQPQGDFGRR